MAEETETQEESVGPHGYYVFNTTGGQSPSVLHATEDEAIEEAQRIALLQPGDSLVICEVVGRIEVRAEHRHVYRGGLI